MKPTSLVIVTFAFGCTLAPGLLFIAYFYPRQFMDMGTGKLVLLALSTTTPIVAFHYFMLMFSAKPVDGKVPETYSTACLQSAASTTLITFLAALLTAVAEKTDLERFITAIFIGNSLFHIPLIFRGLMQLERDIPEWFKRHFSENANNPISPPSSSESPKTPSVQ